MRIAIIAALPGELKHLVSTGFKPVATTQAFAKKWEMPMAADHWIAVCAGMGADAARRAFVEAEADGKVDMVLSVGWAGALVDDLIPGATYVASAVIDAKTGERFELSNRQREDVLITTSSVAQEAEKRRLAVTYRGRFVDMESATILRLAQMRGVPALCLKAISDDLGERLPDFNPYIDANGQMRMMPFLGHILPHPQYWGALRRLGKASSQGSASLASAIFTFLTGPKNVDDVNRTGNLDW